MSTEERSLAERVALRLILRVPSSQQTGPDSWCDTTHHRTYELPCPDDLRSLMEGGWGAVVVGAEIVRETAGGARNG